MYMHMYIYIIHIYKLYMCYFSLFTMYSATMQYRLDNLSLCYWLSVTVLFNSSSIANFIFNLRLSYIWVFVVIYSYSMWLYNNDNVQHKYCNFVDNVLNFASQIEYADALSGFDMFFVSVHKGNHVVGGTKEGCITLCRKQDILIIFPFCLWELWDTFHLILVINAQHNEVNL